tara:strand:- start:82 stop:612 length:531 start_codon:yes stop_codon:yes gene_type:complete
MRLSISTRIFLALTLLSLVILGLNAAVTRWNFQRGFLDYVAAQEASAVNEAAEALAAIYREEGDWESLRDNPRRWNELLRGSNDFYPRRPPAGGRPGIDRELRQPPPPDSLDIRRITLLDADGKVVVGLLVEGILTTPSPSWSMAGRPVLSPSHHGGSSRIRPTSVLPGSRRAPFI